MTAIPAPGFADPQRDAQQTFRAVLEALARPGTRQPLTGSVESPVALGPALTAVALTLFDEQSPVHLAGDLATDDATRAHLAFHTGAPLDAPLAEAMFVVTRPADLPRLAELREGTDEAPHLSATVLIDARGAYATEQRWTATGPGIQTTQTIVADWAPEDFLAQWDEIHARFPRGVDLVLVGDDHLMGLPRTTRLTPVADPTTPAEGA